MKNMYWNKKRLILICVSAVFLFLLFRVRTQEAQFEIVISNAKAIDVWEFVADFSNMKSLNPTILDFDILTESGNYDHWQYSATYTEFLSHLPIIHNYAHAHFNVKPEGKDYVIRSTHNTCFMKNIGCLKSTSEFSFSQVAEGTRCSEKVNYECPAVFSGFCRMEVMYQRRAIMSNLQEQFKQKSGLH